MITEMQKPDLSKVLRKVYPNYSFMIEKDQISIFDSNTHIGIKNKVLSKNLSEFILSKKFLELVFDRLEDELYLPCSEFCTWHDLRNAILHEWDEYSETQNIVQAFLNVVNKKAK